jgi:CTP-dependent riboflavin kinase
VSSWKRHFWTAVFAGFLVSGALSGLSFVINPDYHEALFRLLWFAQFPGWLACAVLLPGSFESINTTNYIEIAVPVNAALYGMIIFAALRLLGSKIGSVSPLGDRG